MMRRNRVKCPREGNAKKITLLKAVNVHEMT
jgi:hypothetical protein